MLTESFTCSHILTDRWFLSNNLEKYSESKNVWEKIKRYKKRIFRPCAWPKRSIWNFTQSRLLSWTVRKSLTLESTRNISKMKAPEVKNKRSGYKELRVILFQTNQWGTPLSQDFWWKYIYLIILSILRSMKKVSARLIQWFSRYSRLKISFFTRFIFIAWLLLQQIWNSVLKALLFLSYCIKHFENL